MWGLQLKKRKSTFTGILSSDAAENPTFYNWNKVMVFYCDGGGFVGDRTGVPYNASFSLNFHGQRIVLSVMHGTSRLLLVARRRTQGRRGPYTLNPKIWHLALEPQATTGRNRCWQHSLMRLQPAPALSLQVLAAGQVHGRFAHSPCCDAPAWIRSTLWPLSRCGALLCRSDREARTEAGPERAHHGVLCGRPGCLHGL